MLVPPTLRGQRLRGLLGRHDDLRHGAGFAGA
jgi:hypothetical protein